MSILGDFWAFGVKIAIIKKQNLLLSTFKQFSLYYYGDAYAESSKIAKNRPKSRWVVFLESSDFATSKKARFFLFYAIYSIVHRHTYLPNFLNASPFGTSNPKIRYSI